MTLAQLDPGASEDHATVPYEIEWSEEAKSDLEQVPVFRLGGIVKAVEELAHHALIETRNRKPLAQPLEDLAEATWEVRVGEYRVFYSVPDEQTVRILRAILKGARTTADAVARGRGR